jgi:Smr domain
MKGKQQIKGHSKPHAQFIKGGDTDFTHMFADVIDLHISDLHLINGQKDGKYAIEYQIEAAERAIDEALCNGKVELRFIHGIGKGRLQLELHKMLRTHPLIKSYIHDHHPMYGWGSTIVYFS